VKRGNKREGKRGQETKAVRLDEHAEMEMEREREGKWTERQWEKTERGGETDGKGVPFVRWTRRSARGRPPPRRTSVRVSGHRSYRP
jgi:hypothetical protein